MKSGMNIGPQFEVSHQGFRSKAVAWIFYSVLPVFGIGLALTDFIVLIMSIWEGWFFAALPVLIIGAVAALLCTLFGWKLLKCGMAKYRFDKTGVFVTFPLEKEQLIPWSDIQQIALVHVTVQGRPVDKTNIIIVRKGVSRSVAHGRWPESPARYREIFYLIYSPELYEGLKGLCPYDIADLRDTLPYRVY